MGVPSARAALPLAGGRSGATLKLRPLLCAQVGLPASYFHRGRGPVAALKALGVGVRERDLVEIPIPAYLLEHPSAGAVLVDTGMHGSLADGSGRERSRNLGPIGRLMSRHASMRPEQAAAAQLRTLGIDAKDVELVVMTHLHFDHASALCDFPNATVLVDEREWRAAWARGGLLNGYSTAQLDPSPTYCTIDFTGPSVRSRGPFERTIDVFGDGALTLCSTPGHTAGHMSLIARLPEGEALLSADAAYTMPTIRDGERPFLTYDRETFEHSLRQIQAYDRENPDALIIPGHDMDAWTAACELLWAAAEHNASSA
jgi:glyoxylase-like metal-dependent hydrolase (beta-lactamase superfamily II)